MRTWIPPLAYVFVMIFILSNLSIDSDVCKIARNNLPLFRAQASGRGNELTGKLQLEET